MKTFLVSKKKFIKSSTSAIRLIKRIIARIIRKLTNESSFSEDLSKGDMAWSEKFQMYSFKR